MYQEDCEKLAGLFYDGIANPGDWYAALDGLRLSMGGSLFYDFKVDIGSQAVIDGLQNAEVPEDTISEYEQHHAAHDERMPIVMNLAVGQPMFDDEHFSPRQISRSFIYSKWLPSLGYRHTFCMPVHDDGATREFLTIMRPSDMTAFGAPERSLIKALTPDLQRAARLRTRLANLADQAMLGMAALEALPTALAVVDESSRIHFLNTAGRLALAGAGPCSAHGNQLHAVDPAAQAALAHHIAAACRRQETPRAGSICLNGTQGEVIHVLPLQPTHPLAQAHHERPYALLVWAQPDMSLGIIHLATALGLTETEARLALMLAKGHSIKAFARAQGCTWNTARTHARNLLVKTGCHRQAELVCLVQGLL